MLGRIENQEPADSTDIYQPVARALELMHDQGIGDRFPAIILMTDGMSNTGIGIEEITAAQAKTGLDRVPVFGITFGSADTSQLDANRRVDRRTGL